MAVEMVKKHAGIIHFSQGVMPTQLPYESFVSKQKKEQVQCNKRSLRKASACCNETNRRSLHE